MNIQDHMYYEVPCICFSWKFWFNKNWDKVYQNITEIDMFLFFKKLFIRLCLFCAWNWAARISYSSFTFIDLCRKFCIAQNRPLYLLPQICKVYCFYFESWILRCWVVSGCQQRIATMAIFRPKNGFSAFWSATET